VTRERQAGQSAFERFSRARREALWRNRWDWAFIAAGLALCLVLIVVTDGTVQLLAAGVLGGLICLAIVGWLVGDVHSLFWLHGSQGEQWTAEELDDLDGSWSQVHDVARRYGNWDHVVIGPSGVFLIDTKRLSQPARVADDALRAGRLSYEGAGIRRAARSLARELERNTGSRPWVQAVVAIWGAFPQGRVTENDVIYLHAEELVDWLRSQPSRYTDARTRSLAAAINSL
jgi:hypothetical protein